ncbi:hypothetical protein N7474_000754 [Penicillium riverlandense]|uniref:uncharacterized protein n=1 Tax=Penicillium riverlandense TaxID=1903569 RepID=UPI002547D487|nr:uncharacterized protein N7474_000754 [Penicillium riverlandense]KAJ5832443.1 hypothetical protein N7474_000754 [Penicillium riverlandense]
MVLDDASPQAGGFSNNNASDEPSTVVYGALGRPLKIKPELMTRPDYFTLYFGFFGHQLWNKRAILSISERVRNTYVICGRDATQEEVDAFVQHGTRELYHGRIGLPVSLFAGTAYLYNSARKSPMFPADPTPANLLATVRNFAASDRTGFRQVAFRAGFKLLFWGTLGAIVSSTFSTSNYIRNILGDPRLENFRRDMAQQKPEERRKRNYELQMQKMRRLRGEGGERQSAEDTAGAYAESHDNEQDSYGSPGSLNPSSSSSSPYNASPTENDMTYNATEFSKQSRSADQPRSVPDASRRPRMNGSPTATQGMGNESGSGGDYFFGDDDNSPTAPEYRGTNPNDTAGGSAWDRIRRQNASGPQYRQGSSQLPSQQNLESEGDKYESERNREREQAQAEFDRMMDAERNAPSDGPRRGRGWGS